MDFLRDSWKEVTGFVMFLFTSLVAAVTWLVKMQGQVNHIAEEVREMKIESKETLAKLEHRLERQLDVISNDIKTILRGLHDR